VRKSRSHLLGCTLIKVGHRDMRAFFCQPGGTCPTDTVRSAGNYRRGAGEASKFSLVHLWSLPRFRLR
jgi:hypothetical protein